MYSEHFTDIRPSPRKAEGHKKQVLPKEVGLVCRKSQPQEKEQQT